MSKVDWSLAPEGATHYNRNNRMFYVLTGDHYRFYCRDGELSYGGLIGEYLGMEERQQSKPWSGPEDGLPPVGTECEVDHGNGKHWDKVTIVAHHCEKAIYLDPVREIHYIWGLVKDFRTIRTPDQIASEQRETAIRELMDIAQVDCRVTAARLVDAGFKQDHMKF